MWLVRVIQDAPEPGERKGRMMMAAGHYLIVPTTAWAVYSIGYGFEGIPPGPADWAQEALFTAFMACFYCDLRWHSMRLCERCAALTPIDPQTSVRRWRQALRSVHLVKDRKAALLAFVAITVAPALTHGAVSRWLYVVAAAVVGSFWVATWRHGRLRPWCPWCNWGKGGDEEVSPEVPDPALSK